MSHQPPQTACSCIVTIYSGNTGVLLLRMYCRAHLSSDWGERERAPSCGLNYIYIYIYRRAYVHRYCACAALRANVAGQIWNRFSPAESAFSACIGIPDSRGGWKRSRDHALPHARLYILLIEKLFLLQRQVAC